MRMRNSYATIVAHLDADCTGMILNLGMEEGLDPALDGRRHLARSLLTLEPLFNRVKVLRKHV